MSEKKTGVTHGSLDQPLYSSDRSDETYWVVLMDAQGLVWRLLGDQEHADETRGDLVADQLVSKIRAGEVHQSVLIRLLETLRERKEGETPTYRAVKKALQKIDK